MLSINISYLLFIIVILMVCGSLLLPICAINFRVQPLHEKLELSDELHKTMSKEFLYGNNSNTSRYSLRGARSKENVTFFNQELPSYKATLAFDTPSWQLTQSVWREYDESVSNDDDDAFGRHRNRNVLDENLKIRNDFHYRINKSNQENNFYNNKSQPTPLLSNIKLVNSSTLSSLLPSLSPEATASRNSTSSSSSSPLSSSSMSYFERVELQESLAHTKNEKLLLHRNKRYLLFPDGSSFQLVFDLIIAIVDYTNFAIMGITCAVAWELPSKPPSEIIENFRTKLNDGTFGLSRRNDSIHQQLEYINGQRTELEAVEDSNKRWREGVTDGTTNLYNQHYPMYQQHQQKLSATVATTSGHEQFLTNAQSLPPSTSSSNFYYNNNNNFQQPTPTSKLLYSPQRQQQPQSHYYNFKTFDTNQRESIYANENHNREPSPIYKNDFAAVTNKNIYYQTPHPADNWNTKNWQQMKNPYHPPPPEMHHQPTKVPYIDAGDYWNKDNWWNRNKNRIEKDWQENQQKWSKYKDNNPHLTYYQTPMSTKRTGRNRKILNKTPKHRIYPIFGKRRRRRSAADHNDDFAKILQNIHTKEHLQTRQKLYGKIEKLYETRGQNGTACVLRALCETEKFRLNAHYNETPQSFVMELLRSIFALPKDTLTNSKDLSSHLHDRYTEAILHAHDVTSSCSQMYHDCKYSISYDT